MARRARRKFCDEQKADAVRVARETGSVAKTARNLDLSEQTLRRWIKRADIDEGKGAPEDLTSDERKQLQRLQRENKILQQERDFLQKAAAFFASQSDPRPR